jgi:hypothetical protein
MRFVSFIGPAGLPVISKKDLFITTLKGFGEIFIIRVIYNITKGLFCRT